MAIPGAPGREESEPQRLDRNLAELLQELRVAGLGIQVLFGFILALPFSNRFEKLGPWQRSLYLGDLFVAALAIVLLGGPVAYHRVVFRHHEKAELVAASNRMALGGLAAVALAVSGAVLLVSSFVAGTAPAIVITALVGAAFLACWLLLPLGASHLDGHHPGSDPDRVGEDGGRTQDLPGDLVRQTTPGG
jgi:O-antigen/teichoic acid export membrane protein